MSKTINTVVNNNTLKSKHQSKKTNNGEKKTLLIGSLLLIVGLLVSSLALFEFNKEPEVANAGLISRSQTSSSSVDSSKLAAWDVDLNGKVDSRDGILITGYMFGGNTFNSQVPSNIDTNSKRNTVESIRQYIDILNSGKFLDIDGNGKNNALSDGILITRYFTGVTGTNLTNGAVAPDATRKTPESIIDFINKVVVSDSSKLAAWDVDLNGKVDSRDGILITGYMFGGNTFNSQVPSNIDTNSKRNTVESIRQYIDILNSGKFLDIDGNGKNNALSDGILITRYFTGVTGTNLTNGAVAPDATRKTPESIIDFINKVVVSDSSKLAAWDVDLNGKVDSRDGILITGYMFGGNTFNSQVPSNIDTNSKRNTVESIRQYIDILNSGKFLDIDGNGKNNALSDGILITRYFTGVTGTNLTNGAVAPDATRKTPESIIDFINKVVVSDSSKLAAWDVDLNGKVDSRDGILITGYMFGGNTFNSQVPSNIDTNSKRNTVESIRQYIDILNSGKFLDIDGNGKNNALSDGILITRYFTGVTGTNLTNGAVAPDATRKTPESIIDFINKVSGVRVDGVTQ